MLETIVVVGIVVLTVFMAARSIYLALTEKVKGNCCKCETCALMMSESANAAEDKFVSIKKAGNTGNGSLPP